MPLAGPTAAGQLATLADLPFELLSEILSLVEPETIFKLVLVSYRLFTLLTPVIYPEGLKLTAEQARKYLYPRVSDLPFRTRVPLPPLLLVLSSGRL